MNRTIQNIFKEQFPKESDRLDKSNCYDFKIIGPCSFEDETKITVRIKWKENTVWKVYNIIF